MKARCLDGTGETYTFLLVETPAHLRRRMDPSAGLALIDLRAE